MWKMGKTSKKIVRPYKIFVAVMGVTMSLGLFGGNMTVFAAKNGENDTNSAVNMENSPEEQMAEEEKEELVFENPTNVNLSGYDVVYVIDNSKSVWKQQAVRNQAFKNISNLAIGSDIRIGVVYFADQVYQDQTLGLTSVETEEGSKKVNQVLDMYDQDKHNIDTNIGNALETAVAMFDSQDSSRKRAVILFSDGINENSKGQAAYKEAADAMTLEQVQKLERMNVPIYCVYLQKARNDEAYLQQLVNYFKEENDFVEERFAKVDEANIDDLKPTFTNVFYALQNNMKYRDIALDSTGALQFYVPNLGITKLRVYLDGDLQEGTMVLPAGESEKQIWSDGSAAFWAYTNPAPGNWALNVASSDLSQVHGTISYHADLRATAKLLPIDLKHEQLVVQFHDRLGLPVNVDKMAKVFVRMHLAGEDGKISSQSVAMNIVDGVAQSDPIDVSTYGTYSFTVNLTYEDFINLFYEIPGNTTVKHAPEVLDYRGKWYHFKRKAFLGEKTEEGIQFAIDETLLWADPEEEEVNISEVVQLKAKNEVKATQKDGYVYITAQNIGNVEFELQITDASGMTATVPLKGYVWTRGLVWIMILCFVLSFTATFIPDIYRTLKKTWETKRVKAIFAKWNECNAEYGQLLEGNMQKSKDLEALKIKVREDLYTDPKSGEEGFLDICAQLHEDLKTVLEIKAFTNTEYINQLLAMGDELLRAFPVNVDKMKILATKKNALLSDYEKGNIDFKMVVKPMEDMIFELSELVQEQKKIASNMDVESRKLEKEHERICELATKAIDLIDATITCDLQVETQDQKMGAKRCFVNNHYLQGTYALDDVRLLGAGTLGEYCCQTHIFVCGCAEENGHLEGLRLLSANAFQIVDLTKQNLVTTKDIMLERGTSHQLIFRTELGMEKKITLTIK